MKQEHNTSFFIIKNQRHLRSIFLFFFSFAVMLFLVDVYILSAGISRISEVEFTETTGKRYRPGYNYVWFSEGFSMGAVNAQGYLGPGYQINKQKGVKRIALLGDSYVEGFQVFDRNHFRTVLEKELNQVNSDSVQVLNFGRSNFNLPNMYAYQKLMVDKYEPDLILYFLSEEDLTSSETDPLLPNTDTLTLETKPYLSNSKLQKFTLANKVLKQSALAYMLNAARRKAQENTWLHTIFDGKFDFEFPLKRMSKVIVPELTIEILNSMDADKVILVYREKKTISPECLNAINESGLQFINLTEPLLSLERNGNNPNYWPIQNTEGHWNVEGHKAVGEKLGKLLR